MATRGRKKAITEPAAPLARDPRDEDGSKDVNPFGEGNPRFHGDHHDNPLLTKETESEPIIWDIGDEEEEYPFVNKYLNVIEEQEEIIGEGSYGIVGSLIDTHTGEKVAIKKINDVFEHVSDTTRILREIKLLRLPKHPDIVEIKHIMLPPSRREFKDIYVVFELMESDLH
ncbi:mitogen-activated protein kinase 9 isoform X1 [Tanacetum coccineum]|uniref:Mitogen-activated protein kinase 9 isoform X1 n=1 Tax=Tanacetum coccineum TaxID=301880 RepID=A0ABQ4YV33_9ASTR